ncbi:MAG: endolytic transglycosylase MltG [Bryobacteraceae bacterium]
MKLIRALVLLGIICSLGAAVYLAISLNSPYSGFGQQTFLDFPKGTSTQQMASKLADAGVVRNTWAFLLARAIRRSAKLQAGEYRFAKPASPLEVFDRIARGDIFYYELVVPEGKNMFDIGAAIEQLGLFPAKEFLKAARGPALIRDLDPQAPSLEGYLFPDTYRLSRHTTPEHLCRIMTDKFRAVWRGLQTEQSPHRIVTLASLVEKEGKLAEEKPLIAAVFQRRLAIGMKLDCDPTTIYAALLDGTYRGVIHRSDLASSSPYNTYQHSGLPPGPIANPGVRSLQAALHPADATYLYFVARGDGSGGHRFSSSLDEQQAAVAQYRRNLAR